MGCHRQHLILAVTHVFFVGETWETRYYIRILYVWFLMSSNQVANFVLFCLFLQTATVCNIMCRGCCTPNVHTATRNKYYYSGQIFLLYCLNLVSTFFVMNYSCYAWQSGGLLSKPLNLVSTFFAKSSNFSVFFNSR